MEFMKVILDTCSLLWWWSKPQRLTPRARDIIRDPGTSVYVSVASAWEISTKCRIGKLPLGERIMSEWEHRMMVDRFQEINITTLHAFRAGTFAGSHRDPFDRMIAAQSMIEQVPVVTPDEQIESLGAGRIW